MGYPWVRICLLLFKWEKQTLEAENSHLKKKRDILKKNFKGLSGSVLEEWKEWGIGSERWTYWQYGNRTSGDSGQLEGLELLGGLRQTGM